MRFVGILSLWIIFGAAALAGEPSSPASSPAGWTISPLKSPGGGISVCMGAGPRSDDATLSLVTEGPQLSLVITGPSMPKGKGEYPVALSTNEEPPIRLDALRAASSLGIIITGDLAERLASAKRLRIGVATRTYQFAVRKVSEAMDAVSRCAGMPTHAETLAHPPWPIPNAGAWTLLRPDRGRPGCSVRVNGPEIDTNVILNKNGKVLLAPGHADWVAWPGEREVTLQIDEWPAVTLKAWAINSIVIVSISDDTLAQRLQHARTLTWMMPTGTFSANVEGIGTAIDALRSCEDQRRRGEIE